MIPVEFLLACLSTVKREIDQLSEVSKHFLCGSIFCLTQAKWWCRTDLVAVSKLRQFCSPYIA